MKRISQHEDRWQVVANHRISVWRSEFAKKHFKICKI